jgi:hypothetical protein
VRCSLRDYWPRCAGLCRGSVLGEGGHQGRRLRGALEAQALRTWQAGPPTCPRSCAGPSSAPGPSISCFRPGPRRPCPPSAAHPTCRAAASARARLRSTWSRGTPTSSTGWSCARTTARRRRARATSSTGSGSRTCSWRASRCACRAPARGQPGGARGAVGRGGGGMWGIWVARVRAGGARRQGRARAAGRGACLRGGTRKAQAARARCWLRGWLGACSGGGGMRA